MQFAISGYYGCGNAGDEAVLAGIRESFARRDATSRLLAFSQSPEETARLHHIVAVDRWNFSAVRLALRESDMLLSGGGSLLQDTTSVRSLLYYLWVIRLAYAHRVPVMFYAQGIGPLRRAFSRSVVRIAANRAAYITVRDEPSARLLLSMGVTHPTIEVTADPAFALHPAPSESVLAVCREAGIPADAPLIGVALRPWGGVGESPVASYAKLLTGLETQCGARVVLLPMQVPGDVRFAEQVAEETGRPDAFPIVRHACSPEVLLGIVQKMQVVVAMRLHALIFAARVGALPFALSYDPKVEHLMRGLELEDCLEHWRGFDPDEVVERIQILLNEREARSTALLSRRSALERLALRNADCALDVANPEEKMRRAEALIAGRRDA
jgi:polysaccharide pyruvyl transferase CsaB